MAVTDDRMSAAPRVSQAITRALASHGIQTERVSPEIWLKVGQAAFDASRPQAAWGDMIVIRRAGGPIGRH